MVKEIAATYGVVQGGRNVFEDFRRIMNYQDVLFNYVNDHFQDMCTNFSDALLFKENLNVLDVGCGSGELTVLIADMLFKINPSVSFSILDPSEVLLESCKEKFQKLNIPLSRCYCTTIESLATNQKFDIVFALHSLYGFLEKTQYSFDFKIQIMKDIIEMVETGGEVLFAIAADESHDYRSKSRSIELVNSMVSTSSYSLAQSGILKELLSHLVPADNVKYGYVDSIVNATCLCSDDPNDLIGACKGFIDYSIRLDTSVLSSGVKKKLKKIFNSDIILFKYLPEDFKNRMKLFPPAHGPLEPTTPVFLHKDYVAIIRRGHVSF